MKRIPYTKFKNNRYYFQRRIPDDVRGKSVFQGKPAVLEISLQTADPGEAMRLASERIKWFEGAVELIRNGLDPQEKGELQVSDAPPMTPLPDVPKTWADAQARRFYDHLIKTHDTLIEARKDYPVVAEEVWNEWVAENLGWLNTNVDRLEAGDIRTVRRQALKIYADEGLIAAVDMFTLTQWMKTHPIEQTATFKRLSRGLIKAWLDAYRYFLEVEEDEDASPRPKSRLLLEAPEIPDLRSPLDYDISRLANRMAEAGVRKTPTWTARLTRVAGLWVEFGYPSDVRKIRKSHVIDFVELLSRCPANLKQRLPGKSVREAIERNMAALAEDARLARESNQGSNHRVTALPTLSPGSIKNAYLAPLVAILHYAESRELIAKVPTKGVKIDGFTKKGKRSKYEIDELNAMLRLPQFTGCLSNSEPLTPGNVLLDDHYYWVPLLALFTGARTGELAQLKLDEVRLDSAHPHLIIQSDDGRRLKTESATRLVPLHPHILELGFPAYVSRQRRLSETRLFPKWEQPKNKGYADAAAQRHFKRNVIPRISVRTDPRPTFHSFRNTMKSAMADSGVPRQHQDAILGHAPQDNDQAYLTTGINLASLDRSMKAVRFDGLEWKHLVGTRD